MTKSVSIWLMARNKINQLQWDGKHIRTLRRHLGLTQRELADQLGTRQQTISEWEKGMYKPRGASATLLSIVAERARFKYNATPAQKRSDKP
ncbi:MAG: helix-turn-helix transcriptional regulator [Dehalococcoidales bacterium]|nr:helix-turn-helix transcriptional regulator [Dehalococcoidales bacterium]